MSCKAPETHQLNRLFLMGTRTYHHPNYTQTLRKVKNETGVLACLLKAGRYTDLQQQPHAFFIKITVPWKYSLKQNAS